MDIFNGVRKLVFHCSIFLFCRWEVAINKQQKIACAVILTSCALSLVLAAIFFLVEVYVAHRIKRVTNSIIYLFA